MRNYKPVKEVTTKPKAKDSIVVKPPKSVYRLGNNDNSNRITAYELKPMMVGDVEVLARPIQWNGKDYSGNGTDKDGRPIDAIVWAATCPKCNQLMQILATTIVVDNNNICHATCDNCVKPMQSPKPALIEQPKNPPFPKFSENIDKLKEEMKKPKVKTDPAMQTNICVQAPKMPDQPDVVVNIPPTMGAPKTKGRPSKPTEAPEKPSRLIEYETTKKNATEDSTKIEGFEDPIKAGLMTIE